MVCLGASGTVVCLLGGRSIRVLCVPYILDLDVTPLTLVVSHFQSQYSPALPTDIPSPPGLLP